MIITVIMVNYEANDCNDNDGQRTYRKNNLFTIPLPRNAFYQIYSSLLSIDRTIKVFIMRGG